MAMVLCETLDFNMVGGGNCAVLLCLEGISLMAGSYGDQMLCGGGLGVEKFVCGGEDTKLCVVLAVAYTNFNSTSICLSIAIIKTTFFVNQASITM